MSEQPTYVYVVDDSPASAMLLADLLMLAGYITFVLHSGQEVIQAVENANAKSNNALPMPDLILVDLIMPEVGGLEVVRRLKANPNLPFIPIIITTASSETQDKIAGLQVGADDYLTKPVNRAEMLARIRSLLRLKQSYNEQAHLVSQIKLAYQQLTSTQAELLKAETNKAHMEGMLHTAGAICHEISQPLTSALITLQIIRQDNTTNPEIGKEVEEVENSLLHARDILDKLRALTRYETKSYLGEERILDLERSIIPRNLELQDKDVFSMKFEDLIGDD